ncbi:MAG TPA: MerR family transcriptional regulator [Thermoanaerobaculia bacterium]|nr:MerR family transcriptional regulator [Thermoanaerobaculia bacterium]
MLRIGTFARLSGVSVKALRYYDSISLLQPAHVDGGTGYRSYDAAQLAVARRITALKELGFTLEEIALVLETGDFRERLLAKREALCRRLLHIDTLLGLNVVTRVAPAAHVLSLRTVIRSYDETDDVFAELRSRLPRRASVTARGALWHVCDPSAHHIDMEALFYLDEPLRGTRILEPQRVASVVYAGEQWRDAYASLEDWMRLSGSTLAGAKRERFVDAEVTELEYPIA